jgi:hypothetical protein
MNNVHVILVLLSALTALLPGVATAELVHWTCSNNTTVLYMLLDTKSGGIQLFSDRGVFIGQSTFTEVKKVGGKDAAFGASIDSVAIAVLKKTPDKIVLKLDDVEADPVYFECD